MARIPQNARKIGNYTPTLDGFAKDIARLKDGCELLEETYLLMHTGFFPDARPFTPHEFHARDLLHAIRKALKAGEKGTTKEMSAILENAIVEPLPAYEYEKNEREEAAHLVSKIRDHFGFDDSE